MSTSELHNKTYIRKIRKLGFNLSHVHILGTRNCGKEIREVFKRRRKNMKFYAGVIMQSVYYQFLHIK